MHRLALAVALAVVLHPSAPRAQGRADPAPGTAAASSSVSTQATARRRLPNTVADAGVTIEAHARTLVAVQRALGDGSAAIVAYLRGAGAERLRTDALTIEPETESVRRGPDRIVGYAARLAVSFRAAPERVGELLAGSLERGANGIGAVVVTPREEEVDAARQELVATATRTALAQVGAIAGAAGRRVGGPLRIVVDPAPIVAFETPGAYEAVARAAPRPAPRPPVVAAGDVELTVTVAVTAALE